MLSICWAKAHAHRPAHRMKPANQRRRSGHAHSPLCYFLSLLAGGAENQPRPADVAGGSVLWCSCPFMSMSDSESAEDQVLAKHLGGWRFPAALKHITQDTARRFQAWKSGCDLLLVSHSSSCLSSCVYLPKVFIVFILTVPFQAERAWEGSLTGPWSIHQQ